MPELNAGTEKTRRFEAIAEEVYEPLQRYLFRRAPRQDAEDALSEVLLTIWRRVEDAPLDRALPWAYGVARRTLANQRRGKRRALRLVERLESQPSSYHSDPPETHPDPVLEDAMAQLSPRDREILQLWAWEQLEPREIAPVLDISPNAAASRLSRARKKLSEEITRQDHGFAGHRPGSGTEEHPDV